MRFNQNPKRLTNPNRLEHAMKLCRNLCLQFAHGLASPPLFRTVGQWPLASFLSKFVSVQFEKGRVFTFVRFLLRPLDLVISRRILPRLSRWPRSHPVLPYSWRALARRIVDPNGSCAEQNSTTLSPPCLRLGSL